VTDQGEPLRMGGREWALLLALSVLWGGSFFFYKVLAVELPPFTVVLGRVGLAALALNLWLLARRESLVVSRGLWGAFLVLGLLNNVIPFSLFAFAETRISSGLASILNAATPVFTVLAAHGLTRNEKLTWGKGAGVVLGLLGVGVLLGPQLLADAGREAASAQGACLAAAVSYAFASIFGRRFAGLSPMRIATAQVTASTIILIPLVLLADQPWRLAAPSAPAWAALLGLALLSTALAFLIYFRVLAVAGATNLTLVTFLSPVSALLLGFLFLGEHVNLRALGGMALIGLGLAAIDGRLWRATLTALRAPPGRAGGGRP
jgi:drug/metabolite transporter (DMT)-like permease